MTHNRSAAYRNRNSWGPTTSVVATTRGCLQSLEGEEFAEEYTERMVSAQLRQMDPLKEDLADWLNKTLLINYINRDNFLTELSNGVVLFHLAQVIQESAKCSIAKGLIKGPVPDIRDKCFEKARRGSFFSRDNVENFIKFCRSLGVHENLLFESEDLVLNKNARNVILCLLEVARIATRFGVEPPGLVQLEKEIAEEERIQSADSGLGSLLSWQFQAAAPIGGDKMRLSNSASAISTLSNNPNARWNTGPHSHLILVPDAGAGGDNNTNNSLRHRLPAPSAGASDGVPSDHTEEEDEWSRGSGEDEEDDVIDGVRNGQVQEPPPSPEVPPIRPSSAAGGLIANGSGDTSMTELDRKVQLATRLMQNSCRCSKERCSNMRVKKVGEGKYNIAGRNVFVRLLKGRHMMVRVGGGWDTLDHFLLRHDPCQVKIVSRNNVTSNGSIGNSTTCYDTITSTGNSTGGSNSTCSSSAATSPTSPTSPIMYIAENGVDRASNGGKYLHIRAKYRSPPPRENGSVAR